MDNKILIQSAQYGDKEALEKLLSKTEKEIRTFLYFLTKSQTDTEDMVQEILFKIAGKLRTLKNPSMYKAWVNKITIRQYYDYLRKNKRKKEDYCLLNEIYENPIDDILGDELIRIIKKSLCKLPEKYKIPILMREFEGLSYLDIAKITNTDLGTVKSRIARARGKLKEYIKPYLE